MSERPEQVDGYSVIYHFTLDRKKFKGHLGLPKEYAVVDIPDKHGGCMVYARYSKNGEWECNPPVVRPLVRHLLDLKFKADDIMPRMML